MMSLGARHIFLYGLINDSAFTRKYFDSHSFSSSPGGENLTPNIRTLVKSRPCKHQVNLHFFLKTLDVPNTVAERRFITPTCAC